MERVAERKLAPGFTYTLRKKKDEDCINKQRQRIKNEPCAGVVVFTLQSATQYLCLVMKGRLDGEGWSDGGRERDEKAPVH